MDDLQEGTVQLKTDSLGWQAGCPERYEVKGLIGSGGMGMVFRAHDIELGRDVAIKVLFFEGAQEEDTQERFMREAKALSVLNHPNIVKVFSSGLNSHGNPYHVMEYLHGVSLAQEIASNKIEPRRFFNIMRQLLSGLQHAHEQKIVHRDLKPSNIMLCQNADGSEICKVIDFGIARMDETQNKDARTLTRTDSILGSPFYISPEQCYGQRGNNLSDIYALGCIMFECIAGKPPFQGETTFETMYKHMNEKADSLENAKSSENSKKLASIIAQCLEKKAEDRPQSVSEIANVLEAISSANNSDELDLFAKRTPKREGKKHNIVILIGTLLLCSVLGFAVWTVSSQSNKASDSFFSVKSKEQVQEHEIEKFRAQLARWKDPSRIHDEARKSSYFNDIFALGRALLLSGSEKDCKEAENLYASALKFCRKQGKEYALKEIACLTLMAKAEWMQGNFKSAEAHFREANELIKENKKAADIIIDIRLEEAFMHLEQRNFVQTLQDLDAACTHFDNLTESNFVFDLSGKVDKAFQTLDRKGDTRFELLRKLGVQLRSLKPGSESETVDMVLLSNVIADRLGRIRVEGKKNKRLQLDYSVFLSENLHNHDDLRSKTRALRRALD